MLAAINDQPGELDRTILWSNLITHEGTFTLASTFVSLSATTNGTARAVEGGHFAQWRNDLRTEIEIGVWKDRNYV